MTAASLHTDPGRRWTGPSLEGNLVAGRYRIERPLARGTWARLYEAWDEREERTVALKILASEEAEVARRFEMEARTAGEVRHPNVLEVYDRGHLEDGTPFLVMELLEGPDLAAHLEEGRPPIAAVVDLGRQLAAALGALEEHGIVHRDVKPQNIVIHHVDDRLVAKLVDFGISKQSHGLAPETTDGGMVVGTPYYLSPEQVQGAPVDGRSDLFSLGVVLYEALTGRHPHTGESVGALAAAILEGPVPPVRERRPECPRSLAQLIEGMLAKSPEDRPQRAREVRDELERIGRALELPRGAEAWEEPSEPVRPSAPEGRRRWAWLAVVALLVLAGATAWGWIGPW